MVIATRTSLMDEIDGITLSARVSKLREEYLACTPGISAEQAVLATRSWQETEGKPLDIRRAKQLKKLCDGVEVPIRRGHKLVGGLTRYFRWTYAHVQYNPGAVALLLKNETGGVGGREKAIVTPEDRAALGEALKYWQGRSPTDKIRDIPGGYGKLA